MMIVLHGCALTLVAYYFSRPSSWFCYSLIANDVIQNMETEPRMQGKVFTTIFGVMVGASFLGLTAPGLTALGKVRQAGYYVFNTIERKPAIDVSSPEGYRPDEIEGRIEFKEVYKKSSLLGNISPRLYLLAPL